MLLHEILYTHGTDKVNYSVLYHALFEARRMSIGSILEIGIGTLEPEAHSSMVGWARDGYRQGASLRVWKEYFPNAAIYGWDVQPDTQFTEPGIKTFLCDSTDSIQVAECIRAMEVSEFDLVIDDGSHLPQDQLATLENVLPYVCDGGIYVIEDIDIHSPLTQTPELIGEICGRSPYFCVGFKRNLVVICKRNDAAPDLFVKRL